MPPASRLPDMHACPTATLLVPHVGGPIASMPAAVIGDSCVCVGPSDTIAKGSATVMIGRKPAAGMGDPTAHGRFKESRLVRSATLR